MSTATDSKAARRQVATAFKGRKVPQGVFAIRCTTTGECWVGASTNLDAARNSQWFQLRAGQHRTSPSLQAAWKRNGEEAFIFEVLEQLDEDVSPLLLHDMLRTKKKAHSEALGAQLF